MVSSKHAKSSKSLRIPFRSSAYQPVAWLLMLAKFLTIIFRCFTVFLFKSAQFPGSAYLALFACWFCWFAFFDMGRLGAWCLGGAQRPFSGCRPGPSYHCHVPGSADAIVYFSHHLAPVDASLEWRSIHWPAFIGAGSGCVGDGEHGRLGAALNLMTICAFACGASLRLFADIGENGG